MKPFDLAPHLPSRAYLSLLAMLGITLGCSPKPHIIQPRSSIDYATFHSAPIAVGGMTSIVGSPESRVQTQEARSAELETMMFSERKDLVVIPIGRVRSLLGDRRYDRLLQRFESHGELDAASIAEADSAIGSQARFLMLGRIKQADVSHDEDQSDPDHDPKTDNDKVERKTTLTVRAGFQVYDLRAQTLVWSADVENSKTNTATKSDGSGGSWVVGLVRDLLTSDEGKYPPPPDIEATLPGLFDDMCEGLPKPAKK